MCEDGSVCQITNYYASGLPYFDQSSNKNEELQPYKYNGKELDSMHGLNLYDFSARQYDPSLGQFTAMDPLCEKYYHLSPYAYCGGNPVKYVDPDGRKVKVTVGNTPIGMTSINLYSSAERKKGNILGQTKISVPVYEVEVSNESGSSNTYYFTRIGYRKDYNNQGDAPTEVTFDVRNDGDTFPAVVKSRWDENNNVLELRNPKDINDQTVSAKKGRNEANRTAVQFHLKGATDGCLLSVGKSQIENAATEIRSNYPSTSKDAQAAFMNDIQSFNNEDKNNKYKTGIHVSFKQLY